MVLAIHGPHEIDVPAALTVGSIRLVYGDVLSPPLDAESLVNGEIVSQDYVLKDEDVLEFIRASGRKAVFMSVTTRAYDGFQIRKVPPISPIACPSRNCL